MKPEYQRIVDEELDRYNKQRVTCRECVTMVAERCEALASKSVRELTDAECYRLWTEIYDGHWRSDDWHGLNCGSEVVRKILSAHIAKQSEPDEIPFDQKKLDEGGWKVKLYYKDGFNGGESIVTKVTLVRKP